MTEAEQNLRRGTIHVEELTDEELEDRMTRASEVLTGKPQNPAVMAQIVAEYRQEQDRRLEASRLKESGQRITDQETYTRAELESVLFGLRDRFKTISRHYHADQDDSTATTYATKAWAVEQAAASLGIDVGWNRTTQDEDRREA